MIYTITLNPAIDRTILLESLAIDQVNRIQGVRRDVGGKGLNVSKTLLALGTPSTALAILAGPNGKYIEHRAQEMGLTLEALWIDGDTRENLKIVDTYHKTYTDLNEPGPASDHQLPGRIIQFLKTRVISGDIVVISGSGLPQMLPSIFANIIDLVHARGATTLLDVAGDALAIGIKAQPDLIKPNVYELETLMARPLKSLACIEKAARDVIRLYGVKTLVVSMGSQGLLWVDASDCLHAPALVVPVKSTVGAGDAVVAALAHGLSHDFTKERLLATAIATAACVIQTEGSASGDLSHLQDYVQAVCVHSIQ